jgi:hypothetical protein
VTEVILVVALVFTCLACIAALAYIAKGINKNNFKWLDVTKDLVFEFSKKQRELEEFAFIEAKERRVYVGMAEHKLKNMYPQMRPEDFKPQPSVDMTADSQPTRSLTMDEYFDSGDADIGIEAGARRRRTAKEMNKDGN